MSAAPLTTWPRFCAEPAAVLDWLGRLRPTDAASKKVVLTLRWMVNEELERRRPGPVPAAITDFRPDEPQAL
ncbi:hypothetical protein MUN81_15490 [Hymenobacter sp. 5317J-9]|uniref:hypothetical protein n=1 Tax=Hymenobacter sp. 5317J-9 TaxID=2932250 RepID=UPI001FD659AE|nr:hypothetical protein [Hymenobacter sp. 5317J-9]UOQ96639.1 hypothetical protein MUN81_15490 [Hymenobacter sp. 5317J-9]